MNRWITASSLALLTLVGCASPQLSSSVDELAQALPVEPVLDERGDVVPGPTQARPLLAFMVTVYPDGVTPTPERLPFAELPAEALGSAACLEAVPEDVASISFFESAGVLPAAALLLTESGDAWWVAYQAQRACLVAVPWPYTWEGRDDVLLNLSVAVRGARRLADDSTEPGTPNPKLMDFGSAELDGPDGLERVVLGEEGLRVESASGDVLDGVFYDLVPYQDEVISRGPEYYADSTLPYEPEIVRELAIQSELRVYDHPQGAVLELNYAKIFDAEAGKDGIRMRMEMEARRIWLWDGARGALLPLESEEQGSFASNPAGDMGGGDVWESEEGQELGVERWWVTPHGRLHYERRVFQSRSFIHEGCRFLEQNQNLIWDFGNPEDTIGVGFVFDANQPPSEGYDPPGCE